MGLCQFSTIQIPAHFLLISALFAHFQSQSTTAGTTKAKCRTKKRFMSYRKMVLFYRIEVQSVHMGTIVERRRKDGSVSYTAQIALKKNGVFIHREAQTFDRKQAAYAWLENKEKALKAPGGLEPREDPSLANVIARCLDETEDPIGKTKKQVLKKIKESELGTVPCSLVTSDKLVSFARTLKVQPVTRASYFSYLAPIFEIAGPAWRYPLSRD